jgi:hypothetical protein
MDRHTFVGSLSISCFIRRTAISVFPDPVSSAMMMFRRRLSSSISCWYPRVGGISDIWAGPFWGAASCTSITLRREGKEERGKIEPCHLITQFWALIRRSKGSGGRSVGTAARCPWHGIFLLRIIDLSGNRGLHVHLLVLTAVHLRPRWHKPTALNLPRHHQNAKDLQRVRGLETDRRMRMARSATS